MKRNRESPLRRVVATNMRRLREERGLSQEALADDADIHRVNISKIERGQHSLSLDNLHWIATALGVRAADLLADEKASKTGQA
jgi:transcriptional regulator with XRE-family HTH domain